MPQNDDGAKVQFSDAAPAVDRIAAVNQALPGPRVERRKTPRIKYQVVATLESVTTGPDDVRVVTRDASPHGTGFVSSGALAAGSRAVLHVPNPDGSGEAERIECRVSRSNNLGNGLFEGSVEFFGEQPRFSETRIRPTTAPRA